MCERVYWEGVLSGCIGRVGWKGVLSGCIGRVRGLVGESRARGALLEGGGDRGG